MNADDPASPAADRRAAWIAACGLAAVAGFYLIRGMPWVHVDDLFFTNAGIELAHTGQMVNHPIDGWLAAFGTDKFYVQLPFYTYSLAGWITLFGVHASGFACFQWMFYGVGSIGLERMTSRFAIPPGARLLLVAVYLTTVIRTGFRSEAEAFGLLFLGLGLLDAAAPFWRKLAALLLLGFSVLTYPLTLGLAVPFTLAIVWLQRVPGIAIAAWGREIARVWALPLGMAVGVVCVSFLAMIHGEMGLFQAVFFAHCRLHALPGGPLMGFLREITAYEAAMFTVPTLAVLVVAGLYVAGCWPQVEPGTRACVAACALSTLGCALIYPLRAPGWAVLLALCAGCSVATGQRFGRARWLIVLVLTGLWVWSQSLWIVDAAARRLPDAAALRAAHDAAVHSGKRLVVDSSTARYVFDYQLPAQTRCLDYLKPWRPDAPIVFADKKDDACWVVSNYFLECWCSDLPRRYRKYPRIVFAGTEFQYLPLCPDQPVVLP